MDEFINICIGESLHPSKPIRTIKELNKSKLSDYRKLIIKSDIIDKGLPYYRFCTDKTYQEMNPGAPLYICTKGGHYNYTINNLNNKLYEFLDGKDSGTVAEFITKENLRFSKYTEFY